LEAVDIQREGIRLKGSIDGFTLRNFNLTHASTPNVSPDLPEGIHVEAGKNILIENGTISGFQMTMAPDRYWNGDGIATEQGVVGVTIRTVTVADNTDGGVDLKSIGNVLDHVTAIRNNRNFRFWGNVEASTLTSIEPKKRGGNASSAHVHIAGNNVAPPVIHIGKLVVRANSSTAPILMIENGAALVTIDDYDIKVPAGTKLMVGGAQATVRWGAKGPPKL